MSTHVAYESREDRLRRLERLGYIHPDCPGCREWYEHPTADPMAPQHTPSARCESGKRPHCSCESCW